MSSIAVITVSGRAIEGMPGDVVMLALQNAALLPAVLASHEAAVVVSDGFDANQVINLASAVVSVGKPVIEVRAARWDGETPSPLSAACRGVISGFGDAGVVAAVRLLRSQSR